MDLEASTKDCLAPKLVKKAGINHIVTAIAPNCQGNSIPKGNGMIATAFDWTGGWRIGGFGGIEGLMGTGQPA
jgi:hypothetical protein